MNLAVGVALIDLLLIGPVVSRAIEEHIELFFLAVGLLAMTLAGAWRWDVASRAAALPLWITLTVIVADVIFGRARGLMDRSLGWMQARVDRPFLCGGAVFVIALLSAMLTSIVAALMLAEVVELMRLGPRARVRVTVAGCFAIGLGSSLTPLGGPLSTLAAGGLGMGFGGLVGEAFAPLAARYVPMFGQSALYWANMVSATMDNATLVALEVHAMDPARARAAIIALLLAGGMLIPGNIPNIVAAAALRIGAGEWARIGIPMGLVLLGTYFALLHVAG
jgi:predicted cation transporter